MVESRNDTTHHDRSHKSKKGVQGEQHTTCGRRAPPPAPRAPAMTLPLAWAGADEAGSPPPVAVDPRGGPCCADGGCLPEPNTVRQYPPSAAS